jgi:transcription elongation factor Elf1
MDNKGNVAFEFYFTMTESPCMNIAFNCDKCGQHVVIDETGAGMTVPCPTCGADLTVPIAGSVSELPVPSNPKTALAEGEQIEREIKEDKGKFVNIEQLDFFGQFSRSSDSRYRLTWREAFAGERTLGPYLLLDGNRVIVRGRMQRPNDGKVSNNGNFVLNSWTGNGEKLSGTFYAFATSGEILVRKKFRANLNHNGISDNGRFAFCDTCTSDFEAHSDKTFVFDLETRTLLSTIDGRADGRYSFDSEHRILSFIDDKSALERRYTFEGIYLGAEQLNGERLTAFISLIDQELQSTGLGHDILMNLYGLSGDSIKVAAHRKLLIELKEQKLLQEEQAKWKSDWSLAQIHRTLADLYEDAGNAIEATAHQEAWLCGAGGREVIEFIKKELRNLQGQTLSPMLKLSP